MPFLLYLYLQDLFPFILHCIVIDRADGFREHRRRRSSMTQGCNGMNPSHGFYVIFDKSSTRDEHFCYS